MQDQYPHNVPGHFRPPPKFPEPNVTVPGPLRRRNSRSLHAPPRGPPHPTHGAQLGMSVGYDTSRQHLVGPNPSSEYLALYSVQSINEPYPLGFRPQRCPGPMTETWPPRASADVQNTSDSKDSCLQVASYTVITSPSGPFTPVWPDAPQEFDMSNQHICHPQMPVPMPVFRDTGKRRALIIAINYSLHPIPGFELKQCIEDAYGMANFLRDNLGFEHDDVRVMTDEAPWDHPTAENIQEAMAALVYDAQPNDHLVLYFSGHALQVKDMSGQEPNGLAECICAIDYQGDPFLESYTPGLVSNITMHEIMVKPLPQQCRLTAIFDSCHSASLLDLPYLYDSHGVVKPWRHPEWLRILRQKASYADVISLSASRDEQEALETERGGALRWAFMESVRALGEALTYRELLRSVREYMRKHRFPQQPQLSSSHEIDTHLRFTT